MPTKTVSNNCHHIFRWRHRWQVYKELFFSEFQQVSSFWQINIVQFKKKNYPLWQPNYEVEQPALAKRFPAQENTRAGRRFASAGLTTSQITCPRVYFTKSIGKKHWNGKYSSAELFKYKVLYSTRKSELFHWIALDIKSQSCFFSKKKCFKNCQSKRDIAKAFLQCVTIIQLYNLRCASIVPKLPYLQQN